MRRALHALSLALPLAASRCIAWEPRTPEDTLPDPETLAPSRAIHLELGHPQQGEIRCAQGFCQQWYRIDVPAPGTLRVEVTVSAASPPLARAVLHDGLGNVLGRANTEQGATLVVESAVDVGAAALLVQSGKGVLPYAVRADLE